MNHPSPEVLEAHSHSTHNCNELSKSKMAGCFYCKSIFDPKEITEWTDDDITAICPYCGIDSVLADESGFPINVDFLSEMNSYWFNEDGSNGQ